MGPSGSGGGARGWLVGPRRCCGRGGGWGGRRRIASERLRGGGAGAGEAEVEGVGAEVGASASGGGALASVHRGRGLRSPAKERDLERDLGEMVYCYMSCRLL